MLKSNVQWNGEKAVKLNENSKIQQSFHIHAEVKIFSTISECLREYT